MRQLNEGFRTEALVRSFASAIQIEGRHFILNRDGSVPIARPSKATQIHLATTRTCGWSLAYVPSAPGERQDVGRRREAHLDLDVQRCALMLPVVVTFRVRATLIGRFRDRDPAFGRAGRTWTE